MRWASQLLLLLGGLLTFAEAARISWNTSSVIGLLKSTPSISAAKVGWSFLILSVLNSVSGVTRRPGMSSEGEDVLPTDARYLDCQELIRCRYHIHAVEYGCTTTTSLYSLNTNTRHKINISR